MQKYRHLTLSPSEVRVRFGLDTGFQISENSSFDVQFKSNADFQLMDVGALLKLDAYIHAREVGTRLKSYKDIHDMDVGARFLSDANFHLLEVGVHFQADDDVHLIHVGVLFRSAFGGMCGDIGRMFSIQMCPSGVY